MIVIEKLMLYPVKSMAGINLQQSALSVLGLRYDRHWMVIRKSPHESSKTPACLVSQRQLPKLATIQPYLIGNECVLRHADQKLHLPIDVDLSQRKRFNAEVWGHVFSTIDEGEVAAQWIKKQLDPESIFEYRLVRFDEHQSFQSKQSNGSLSSQPSKRFADSSALVLVNEASCQALNQGLPKHLPKLPAEHFRANLVVSGMSAWQELQAPKLAVKNHYTLSLIKPAQRCVMIHTHQQTGRLLDRYEPTRSLLRCPPNVQLGVRKAAYFGMHASIKAHDLATIQVGDVLIEDVSG